MASTTTANIYGIYDMSGGATEMVMANMSSHTSNYTYNPKEVGNNFTYNNDTSKYLDTYVYRTGTADQDAYYGSRLGDATGEVVLTPGYAGAWYNDVSVLFSKEQPWLQRGGTYDNTFKNKGIFWMYMDSANARSIDTTRLTLIVY